MPSNKQLRLARRQKKIRSTIFGTKERPRLVVFRSNRHIEAQLINDQLDRTILSLKDDKIDQKKVESANKLGKDLAQQALALKIQKVVFDRHGYKYHGRVRALAEGAREGGLKF